MNDVTTIREEETPSGTVWLDTEIGIQPDGQPLLARHLLRELDIAARWLASAIDDMRVLENVPAMEIAIVRRDFYLRRIQCEMAEGERQEMLRRRNA